MSNAGPPSGEEPPSPPKLLENLTIRLPSGHRFAPNPPPAGISTATPVSVFKSLVAATMASVWIGFSGAENLTVDGLQAIVSGDTDFYLSDLGGDFSFDFGEGL